MPRATSAKRGQVLDEFGRGWQEGNDDGPDQRQKDGD